MFRNVWTIFRAKILPKQKCCYSACARTYNSLCSYLQQFVLVLTTVVLVLTTICARTYNNLCSYLQQFVLVLTTVVLVFTTICARTYNNLCSYLQHIHAHVYSDEQQNSPHIIVTDVYNTNCKYTTTVCRQSLKSF
jgi:hypothetical protein